MSFNWAIAWVNRISVIPGVSDPAQEMLIKLQILLNFRENVSWKSTGNHTYWSVRHPDKSTPKLLLSIIANNNEVCQNLRSGYRMLSFFTLDSSLKRYFLLVSYTLLVSLITPLDRGEDYCDQFTCLSVREHIFGPLDRSPRNFVCRSLVAVARSSSGGVALRYVLPVLWMTWRLAVVGRMAMRGRLNL